MGSKIYAARVDALHQNTYQVLSGLSQQSWETVENDDNTEIDNGINAETKNTKEVKKRRTKKSSYIISADNIDSITLKMPDEFKDVNISLLFRCPLYYPYFII